MASIISAGTTSGTALNMTADTSGQLQLATNSGTTAVTIDTSQNVGIGTSSPGYKLDVRGRTQIINSVAGTSTVATFCNDDTSGTSVVKTGFSNGGVIKASINAAVYNNDFMTFNVGSDTERMRIDSSGNVLVGGTSVGGKLNVYGNSSTISPIYVNDAATGSASQFLFYFVRNGSNVGSIQTTGTATSYLTSSDYRLKENIVPMTGALNKIALLKPVIYTWKQDGSDGQGFIAHELQEVVPDCVSGEKDAVDKEGNPKYQGVDTSFLVATLTAAIQEQQTIINDLKARIETLEAK